MIQFSDNASTAALRERLGARAVAAEPARLGMSRTSLDDQFVTTAEDLALLLERLYRGQVVDQRSGAEMLQMLRVQEQNDLIPAALPSGIAGAHKPGEMGSLLHDAALVYAPAGDYVLVTLTEHDDNDEGASNATRRVSRIVFDAYRGGAAPAASGGITGGVEPSTDREARRAPLIFIESSGPLAGWLDAPATMIAATAALVLAPAIVFGLRVVSARREQTSAHAEAGGRAFAGRRGPGDAIRHSTRAGRASGRGAVHPVGATADIGSHQLLPSRRLQRIGELFRLHSELLDQMRVQFQDELQPLNELLARQMATMQQLLINLEERLRPLNDYADSEEANLEALERRMREVGSDFVARSFSEYVQQQRKRITDTRHQIDQQRVSFLQYGEDQRDAVAVAVARFDDDVEALELNLVEQRKIMMRMLDSMRSDSFSAVKEFLQNREEVLAEMATSGMTDPGEIGRSVQARHQSIESMAHESAHIQSVLQTTDEADRRLSRAAPVGPRPLLNQGRRETANVGSNDDAEEARRLGASLPRRRIASRARGRPRHGVRGAIPPRG
ncbi:MAG: hypothetical protein FJZ92_02935 [Chloroflexi bacterium]|nr:hypothetical protein [Chloroflexota bacterium]